MIFIASYPLPWYHQLSMQSSFKIEIAFEFKKINIWLYVDTCLHHLLSTVLRYDWLSTCNKCIEKFRPWLIEFDRRYLTTHTQNQNYSFGFMHFLCIEILIAFPFCGFILCSEKTMLYVRNFTINTPYMEIMNHFDVLDKLFYNLCMRSFI